MNYRPSVNYRPLVIICVVLVDSNGGHDLRIDSRPIENAPRLEMCQFNFLFESALRSRDL